MVNFEYKGYEIRPTPKEHDAGWSLDFVIYRRNPQGDIEVAKPFKSPVLFSSEQDAHHYCLIMGHYIIDGKLEGFTPAG